MDVPPPIYETTAAGVAAAVAAAAVAAAAADPPPLCSPAACHHGCVVMDMQCFKDSNNEFLLKEVSVLDVTTGTLLMHHVARPPFHRHFLTPDKHRESYWLTRHYHGIDWDQGDIRYVALLDKLRSCILHRPVVYVKGREKKEFVRKHLITEPAATVALDLGDMGCGSLKGMSTRRAIRCNRHQGVKTRCALTDVVILRNWLLDTDVGADTAAAGPCYCCFRPSAK